MMENKSSVFLLLLVFFLVGGAYFLYTKFQIQYNTLLLQTPEDFQRYNSVLLEFEKRLSSYYPLGDHESFRITHAPNYVSFFERIGKPYCILLFDLNNVLIGTCFVIHKKNPDCWYLADLKIDRAHRQLGLVYFLYKEYYHLFTKINQSGFGITMKGGSSNQRMQSITRSLGCNSSELCIYLLPRKQLRELIKNKFFYVEDLIDLKQKKELVLRSTQKRLPLLHCIVKPSGTQNMRLPKGYMYMFCCQEGSRIAQTMSNLSVKPFATALIYSKNMSNDFSFLNTSEI